VTINAYFFDSVNGDRKYTAADFGKAFGIILNDGVIANSDGSLGFVLGGTNYTTVYAGKAVVQGHFIELTGTEILTVPTGTYAGMIVLRVDFTTTRAASLAVRTDQNPQKDTSIWEYPLYNISVTNGVISTLPINLRAQGGAIAQTAPNVVTWTDDPNGVYLNIGTHGGKTYKLFLTSAQPAVGGTTERRAWIQMDA
jgi:hypothetical protein